jgi:hypothetical protein
MPARPRASRNVAVRDNDHLVGPQKDQEMSRPCGRGLVPVDPGLIDRLQAMVIKQTDASLMDRFGISYTTWRKLVAGKPVRASLLERLKDRLALLEEMR